MYNCAVDDPRDERSKPSEDEAFLERLDGLDAGLNADVQQNEAPPERPRTAERSDPLPSIVEQFDALTGPDTVPGTKTHEAGPGYRPLLRLFPSESRRQAVRSSPAASPPRSPAARPPRRSASRALRDIEPIPASAGDAFYGLHEKPFGESPDPRFFYHSTPHDAVVQQLLTSIRRREGLVVLTGDPGLGKTTVCRVILDQLDRRTLTSLVASRIETPEQLLTQMLVDLGVLSWDDAARRTASRQDLRTTLQSFVESLGPLGASAIVFVDDAEQFQPPVFDEIRMLCEAAHVSSLLQVVVVGEGALAQRLRRKENRALQQRVAVRATLSPLPREEVSDYIAHRLGVAGSPRVEFDEAAIDRIAALSGGVPRAVNRLCDRALAHGHQSSAGVITDALVDAAAEDLDLGGPLWRTSVVLGRVAAALFVGAFVIVGAATAAWVFRDALARAVTAWRMIPAAPEAPRRQPAPLRVAPPAGDADSPRG